MKNSRKNRLQWMWNIASLAIIVTFALSSFKSQEGDQSEAQSISAQVANTYFTNYYSTAQPMMQKPEGFAISRAQYQTLTLLLESNPGLDGFRVYNGQSAAGNAVTMTVGTLMGSDQVETIYSSDRAGGGFCPSVCDNTSAITAGN